MFCTVCLTSWDWTTRRINTGAIHNPHHAEWLRFNRDRPREIQDIQCGRELTMNVAVTLVRTFDQLIGVEARSVRGTNYKNSPSLAYAFDNREDAEFAKECSTYMFDAMRIAIHHHVVTIPELARNPIHHTTNETLRVRLLRGCISEADFKREIQRKDKAASRKSDLLNVVTTYRDALIDIIWPFVDRDHCAPTYESVQEWLAMINQLKALEVYINECFAKVLEAFASTSAYSILSDRKIH